MVSFDVSVFECEDSGEIETEAKETQ